MCCETGATFAFTLVSGLVLFEIRLVCPFWLGCLVGRFFSKVNTFYSSCTVVDGMMHSAVWSMTRVGWARVLEAF